MPSALITGAAGGMGQAVCRELLRCGWAVLALDHNRDRLTRMEHALHSPAFTALHAELADPALDAVVRPSLDRLDTLQGLVNLAGVSQGDDVESVTDADWEHSFAVNATGPMRLARLCVPFLRASGKGSIVNVSSPVALVGARKPSYAASKAALLGLTMSLARNLGKYNIRVNAVLPGATLTFLTSDWSEEKQQRIAQGTFLGRLCQPEEIARVLRFLLSDDASYLTGATIDLTAGGMYGH